MLVRKSKLITLSTSHPTSDSVRLRRSLKCKRPWYWSTAMLSAFAVAVHSTMSAGFVVCRNEYPRPEFVHATGISEHPCVRSRKADAWRLQSAVPGTEMNSIELNVLQISRPRANVVVPEVVMVVVAVVEGVVVAEVVNVLVGVVASHSTNLWAR